MDLDNTVQSEISPITRGRMLYEAMYIKCPEQTNPETKGSLVFARAWEERG